MEVTLVPLVGKLGSLFLTTTLLAGAGAAQVPRSVTGLADAQAQGLMLKAQTAGGALTQAESHALLQYMVAKNMPAGQQEWYP